MAEISKIEKVELDNLIDLIKEYLKPENKNNDFLIHKIFVPYFGRDKEKYLMLLFIYFKKLDKAIWGINTIDDKSSYKCADLEKYIEKYQSYFIRDTDDAFDVIKGTLDNLERNEMTVSERWRFLF